MKNSIFCFVVTSLFLTFILGACGAPAPSGGADTAAASEESADGATASIDWKLELVSTPGTTPQVFRIAEVASTPVPKRPVTRALDLLIFGSDRALDYGNNVPLAKFYKDVKPFMHEVFGSANILGDTPYGSPFNYYVTDYEYDQATPAGGECNPGLVAPFIPPQNTPVEDMPAFKCNIALSTVSVSLNLGFIVHREPEDDRSKYNLFSSEYNSYATILHELSHAAFVMSDEALTGDARFKPAHNPNIFGDSSCNNTCSGSSCLEIESDYYRCQPSDDNINLMFFSPSPAPGDNNNWALYEYHFESVPRLSYIYGICTTGGC